MIREMSQEECRRVLAQSRFARLACARNDQPYIVPVTVAYHEPFAGAACFYGFTTQGQKIEWMRANPLVCVEVDEIVSVDEWRSVVGFGRFEELPETPGWDDERQRAQERPRQAAETKTETYASEDERFRAYQLLASYARWWEPGSSVGMARLHRDSAEPYTPLYYKIRIDRVTGHRSTPDTPAASGRTVTTSSVGRPSWLRGALTRLLCARSR